MGEGVIGERRILGNAQRQLQGLVKGGALGHKVLGHADALAILGVEHASGEHHVGHAGRADQARNAHRAAPTDKNPA